MAKIVWFDESISQLHHCRVKKIMGATYMSTSFQAGGSLCYVLLE